MWNVIKKKKFQNLFQPTKIHKNLLFLENKSTHDWYVFWNRGLYCVYKEKILETWTTFAPPHTGFYVCRNTQKTFLVLFFWLVISIVFPKVFAACTCEVEIRILDSANAFCFRFSFSFLSAMHHRSFCRNIIYKLMMGFPSQIDTLKFKRDTSQLMPASSTDMLMSTL